MSNPFDPGVIQKAIVTPRWAALARTDVTAAMIGSWDATLLRNTRVLVPIDVQALYVPPGDATEFVQLPFALTSPDGQPPAAMPEPLAPGGARAPGVHLHWAPPDALLSGSLRRVADGSTNRLGLPPLPDRWVVLRICVPMGASAPLVTGWVLEADTAKAIALDQWPAGSAGASPAGRTVAKNELTGTVGGSLNWAGVYDAVTNRLAFHDSLADLEAAAPQGVVDNLAAYVVAGWWSDPALDPLDDAQTSASLHTRLQSLGWRLLEDAEGGDQIDTVRAVQTAKRDTLGLKTAARYRPTPASESSSPVPAAPQGPLQQAADPVRPFTSTASRFVDQASSVVATEPRWPRSTLVHGVIHGVPVRGPVVADRMPDASAIDLAMGTHGDDLAAVLSSAGLGAVTPEQRRGTERIVAAFTGQVLDRLGTPDGVIDAEEHEHEAGFAARPGGPGTVDRLRTGATAGPLAVGRVARGLQARTGIGTAAKDSKPVGTPARAAFTWLGKQRADLYKATAVEQRAVVETWGGAREPMEPVAEVREVVRPAPRFHFPIEPMLAVRGPSRSLVYRGDGRFSPDGLLQCRWPSQVPTKVQGVVNGSDLVESLPSGAIPPEVLPLAQSALVLDPYLVPWLAQNEGQRRGVDPKPLQNRLAAESVMRFGANAVYDGSTAAFVQPAATAPASPSPLRVQVADALRRFSLVAGADPDPVGVTAWSQPWIPLWLEWEAELRAADRFDDWRLGQLDMEPPDGAEPPPPRRITGRTVLHSGTARTLAGSIREFLTTEEQRDQNSEGEVDDATAKALSDVAAGTEYLDIVTASLDGIQSQLLGLPVDASGMLRTRNAGGAIEPPVPLGPPQLVVAGAVRLTRARLVDAFGRTLELPVEATRFPARDEVAGSPSSLRVRPRLLRPARWLLRLVDPQIPDDLTIPPSPAEATIDQIDPTKMVNPVAGFLLPDHIDEALEVFDTAGNPLGQLMHEPFAGGVVWEIAPGREGPPDAPPLHGIAAPYRNLALFASGMVATDALARDGKVADPDRESALSAFLRAVDTTLWTVDAFAQMGTEHIVGLVGRPIAVVRATLRLDIDDDLDEVDLSDPARRAEREAAYRALADRAFPVRLGELTRTDDGLLAFFVDDDYTRVHLVDKVVQALAYDSGRGRGQLAQLGQTKQVPDTVPITNPYVVAEDELVVHPGQVVNLTLLMHPRGLVHLTSGVLPRKALQLSREWIQPGLAVMAPSARVGPVLIDPDKVRLPKISSFPKDQIWTRRDTPFTWKNDPILAATQTALLPDLPSSVQEGYIRIAPDAGASGGGGGQ